MMLMGRGGVGLRWGGAELQKEWNTSVTRLTWKDIRVSHRLRKNGENFSKGGFL